MERSLIIKVTSGQNDPERCAQGFTVAATALASGVRTSLWLTGEASWFALPGRAETFELPHSAPLADLMASLLAPDANASITLCTQCATRRGIGSEDVLPGIRIAGSTLFVEEIMKAGAQALVY
ncbi:MAG TPA: DsrE family protein [Candidatus Nanopelagicaceae bacterium]|nr:DsrE family protein [Candidatus Nanopelagicaceae bacterium]